MADNFIVKRFLMDIVEIYDLPINTENSDDYKTNLTYLTDPEMWGFIVAYRYVKEAASLLKEYYS